MPYANGVGVEQELPEDVAQEVARATNGLIDRPAVTEKVRSKRGGHGQAQTQAVKKIIYDFPTPSPATTPSSARITSRPNWVASSITSIWPLRRWRCDKSRCVAAGGTVCLM